eukprot:s1813_g5.t1
MNLAWLPPEKPKSVEARFHFDACVSPFAEAWPALGVEYTPSAATLIAIVECLRSKDKLRLKIPEMASLYSRMGQDLSRDQGGGTLFNQIFGQKSLERFIDEEQWVFIPNHPRPHKDFTGWFRNCPKMEHAGKFYGLKQLVFCDKAECLDGFAARAQDSMIDLMRQCLDKRVVANYYFGPKTLWPASWGDKGIKSDLHELLSRYNIQEELDVSDYVRVYQAIDQRIEKGETSGVTDFVSQTLTRIALHVKNQIEEELHRREAAEDQDESEEELTVEKSESLEMIRKELSDVRFIQAENGSWQPLKKYQFLVSRAGAEKARIKDWPSDALRFFAKPPAGVNPYSRRSIVELMERLGMRDSPTLLKRASFVPLQDPGNFDSVRKELVEATRVIRDGMSERLKDEDRALFEAIETVVMELQIEEVQQLSVDQVLVIENDRAEEAEIDTLDADEGMPRWLVEFKPTSGRAMPIARIKALPAEVFFIGHEDRKLVLTFKGQLVMKDVSENLSKAVIWTSLQKLAPEYQTEFQLSKAGLTDKARTFTKQLRVAIEATRASRGSTASEPLERSQLEEGERQEDQSPDAEPDQSEDDSGLDMENMEKFLMLQEEFKDMKDEDYYASWGSGLEETADPDDGDSPAVEDLLEHAENALNYKRKRRTGKKELDQQKLGTSPPKVPPSAPPDASDAGASDASDVLSPNLPYDVAAEPRAGDGASRSGRAGDGGFSNAKGSSDVKQAVGKRDEETWTESGTRDFRDASAPRKDLQQEEDSETVSRIVKAQRQQIASPRPYSFTRLASFCAAPVTTGQSSSFDINFAMRDFTPLSSGGGESNAQAVGRNGEKIAQLSLESEGYQVLWLNEKEELGLPFDLLIRENGDFSSLLVNGAVDKSRVEELASKVEEGQVKEFRFVEVKSTTRGDQGLERSIFDVSVNEVASMKNLGEHFWLLRTLRVPTGPEDGNETKVRIWPNAAKAVRDGEVKLLMVG